MGSEQLKTTYMDLDQAYGSLRIAIYLITLGCLEGLLMDQVRLDLRDTKSTGSVDLIHPGHPDR